MGIYEDLKAAIADVITTNGNNEITGAILNDVLQNIVSSIGEHATFAGIATPDVQPGTVDQNVFYLATIAGTYIYFDEIVVNSGEVAILTNKTGSWKKKFSGLATQEKLTELEKKVSNIIIDSEMSDTSENAVSNKVIKAYVDRVKGYIDDILGKNVTDAIDNINEILAFLSTISDKDTLAGIFEELKQYIDNADNLISQYIDNAIRALAAVAKSGSYNDLIDKPIIPAVVTESTISEWGFTKNTGTIKGIIMNGALQKESDGNVNLGTVITDISGKQDKLISGTNIKTLNGIPLLGSGNIQIGGSISRVEMTSEIASIKANEFYVWQMVNNLNITLISGSEKVMNRYIFQFRNPKETTTLLTLPDDITWSTDTELDDNGLPIMETLAFCRIEIIERLASLKMWKLAYILFADAEVERVLMANGIGDGIGITKRDAAAVTEFAGDLLMNNTTATSFSEIRYFKGLKKIYGGAFYKATNLVIEELDNPSLTTIGYGAFNSTKLRKIVGLGENVTIQSAARNLGGAFQNCSELTQLSEEAGRSIVFVGTRAFIGTALQGVLDLSNAVTIESQAFRELSGITRIILSDKCKTIGNGVFYKNVNAVIDNLNLAGLISLGGGAFNSVKIGKITSLGGVTSMPVNSLNTGGVFENCTELTEIAQEVLDKLTYLATAWHGCSNLRIDLILPNLIGTITDGFAKCPIQRILDLGAITNLFGDASLVWNTLPFGTEYTLMILPSTLERIGRYAFAGDGNLQALIIKAVIPPSLAAYAFNQSNSTCPVYVPEASVSAYQTATGWMDWASRIRGIGQLATDNPTLYAEIQQYL